MGLLHHGFPAGAEAPPSWSLASPTSRSSISAKQSRRHSSIYYISQVRDNNSILGDIQVGSPLQAQRTSQLHERNASSLASNSRAKDENCVQSSDIPVKVSTLTLAEKYVSLFNVVLFVLHSRFPLKTCGPSTFHRSKGSKVS